MERDALQVSATSRRQLWQSERDEMSLIPRKSLTAGLLAFALGAGAALASEKPSIVLVHGLWADGSSYNEIIPPLQAAGFNVISVQNPLTTLQDDVAAVKRALDHAGGSAILVGHSWGGAVITAAGVDDRVKGLVYVAALAPDMSESGNDLAAKYPLPPLLKHLTVTGDYIWVNKDGVQYFAGDLPQKTQDVLYATQGPANVGLLATKLDQAPAWKSKPSYYVIGKNDNTINPDLERFLAKRMNAVAIEVDSSHVPMISHPGVVVELIEKAAKAAEK
jgi:pimeloyl-ACP methyl ester carboxylesterase